MASGPQLGDSTPNVWTAILVVRESRAMITHVLIVDDDSNIRRIQSLYMNSLGFDTDFACNGGEALDQVQIKRYGIILMDIQMPDMNGLEATAAIRSYEKSEGLSRVPIIATTAGGASRQECIDSGMDDYLPKPVSIEALKEMLDKWLPDDHIRST
jgi:two-component system, sensor histidine kinase and response regulator